MKKLLVLLTIICLLGTLAAWLPLAASANEADFLYDFCAPNEAMIIDYFGTASTLTLPETLGGYTVTAIGEQAITGNDTLQSLTVPGTVQYLYDGAIADCWALKFVLLQDGLKKIGDNAFAYDYSLKRVVIPASVEAIGTGAFAECGELTDVFFGGTEEQWDAVEKGDSNEVLFGARIHFAAPTEATDTAAQPTVTETETSIKPTATATATGNSERKDEPEHTASNLPVWGDANGDGAVNMKDVLALRKYLAGLDVSLTEAADCNGDGAVNMKDVLSLRRFLAGLEDAA